MTDAGLIPSLLLDLVAGLVLGGLYMSGLWCTTRLLPRSRWPAALLLASFFARSALLLAGLWWVSQGHWEGLAAATAGFVGARTIAVTRVRREAVR